MRTHFNGEMTYRSAQTILNAESRWRQPTSCTGLLSAIGNGLWKKQHLGQAPKITFSEAAPLHLLPFSFNPIATPQGK